MIGARGGAGETFVATQVAAAFSARGRETIVLDAGRGELAWALGVPLDADVRTIADLRPVRDEISEEHVRNVLWSHPSGLRAVLAAEGGSAAGAARLSDVLDAAMHLCDVVVVHGGAGGVAADVTLLVLTLDVFAFRSAKRLVERFDPETRWEVVVNRAGRGRVVPADVERVFGRPAIAVLPNERRVADVQDRGELMPVRSRIGRAVARLAARILPEESS